MTTDMSPAQLEAFEGAFKKAMARNPSPRPMILPPHGRVRSAAGIQPTKSASTTERRSSRASSTRWELTMTENRARKRTIRARMAATGEPYTVAARAVDAERHLGEPIQGPDEPAYFNAPEVPPMVFLALPDAP